ncbi:MAG TPA: type II toxin-antitoxin system VapC family toxin [Caulobacteraceae bacterium]
MDTSALIAIVLKEDGADVCEAALDADREVAISAGTLTEILIVAERRGVRREAAALVESLAVEVVPVTEAFARRAADAHAIWGRGAGTAGLNFGDCFAYALAAERACPLLFVGDDFRKTDVTPAL